MALTKPPYAYGDALRTAKYNTGIDVGYNPVLFGVQNSCKWLYDPFNDGSFVDTSAVGATLANQNGTANNATQASGPAQPIYAAGAFGTGLRGLKWTNAASQYLILNSIASAFTGANKSYTIVFVIKGPSLTPAGDHYVWSCGAAGNANSLMGVYMRQSNHKWSMSRVDDTGSGALQAGEVWNSGHVITSPTIITVRSNGALVEQRANGVVTQAVQAQSVGSQTVDRLMIGVDCHNNTLATYLNDPTLGDTFLVPYAIFSDFIEDRQCLAMEQYLAKKYVLELA